MESTHPRPCALSGLGETSQRTPHPRPVGCWVKLGLRYQHCSNTNFLVWGREALGSLQAKSMGSQALAPPVRL